MINYKFLERFEERMANNAKSVQLVLQCASDRNMWAKYDLNNVYERYNVIFSILVYLTEKEYDCKPPTIYEINVFVTYVMGKIKHANFNEDEIFPLTKFLIEDILQNGGITFDKFQCFNFKDNKYQTQTTNFIKSEQEDRTIRYSLTASSYQMVYNSLEIANNDINYKAYKLKQQINRYQYDDAIKSADDMKYLIKQKIELAKDLTNLLQIEIDEENDRQFENLNKELSNTFFEQFKEYDTLKDTLAERKNTAEEVIESDKTSKDLIKSIENIDILDDKLEKIFNLQNILTEVRREMVAAHDEALESSLRNSIISKFSFKDRIFSKILNENGYLENINKYLNPLFFSLYDEVNDKIYSVEKCCDFDVQQLLDEEDVFVEKNSDKLDEKFEKEQLRKKEILVKYRKSLSALIEVIMSKSNHEVTLKAIISDISNEKYKDFAPSVEIIKNILIKLTKLEHLHLNELREDRDNYIETDTTQFLINKEIIDLLDYEYGFTEATDMYISSFDEEESVFLRTIDNQGIDTELECTNLIFSIKKER